jgi:hypothetical protein
VRRWILPENGFQILVITRLNNLWNMFIFSQLTGYAGESFLS